LNFFNQKSTFFSYFGDCHTSDIGHWFAMTGFLTYSGAAENGSVCYLFKDFLVRIVFFVSPVPGEERSTGLVWFCKGWSSHKHNTIRFTGGEQVRPLGYSLDNKIHL